MIFFEFLYYILFSGMGIWYQYRLTQKLWYRNRIGKKWIGTSLIVVQHVVTLCNRTVSVNVWSPSKLFCIRSNMQGSMWFSLGAISPSGGGVPILSGNQQLFLSCCCICYGGELCFVPYTHSPPTCVLLLSNRAGNKCINQSEATVSSVCWE